MRRIADLLMVAGVAVLAACDANSPVTPPEQPQEPQIDFVPSIAFQSDRDGSPYIYVANGDGTKVARLVQGLAPAWSRDGGRIAYYSFDDGFGWDIYIMDADGSHQRWLVGAEDWGGQRLSWGPGDHEIAYRGDGGIFAIAVDGSTQPRELISDDLALPRADGWNTDQHSPGWVETPEWSVNGDQLAFVRVDPYKDSLNTSPDRNWYLVNADGSNLRMLGRLCTVPAGWHCPATTLAWSPDDGTLAVGSWDVSAGGELDTVLGTVKADFDPERDRVDVLYRAVEGNWVGDPQWSPDGSAIVFEFGAYPYTDRGTRIMDLSLDGGVVKQLIPEAAHPVVARYNDAHPVWRRVP
jgi:Tol biopolymer transport system component